MVDALDSRSLITRVQLQVNLHAITNRIIRQRQLIMKRPLALSLQHDLVYRPPNLGRYHSLQHLDGITWQTRDLGFGAESIIDRNDNHGFVTDGRSSGRRRSLLLARLAFEVATRFSRLAFAAAIAPVFSIFAGTFTFSFSFSFS